jgi:hypothetical protein
MPDTHTTAWLQHYENLGHHPRNYVHNYVRKWGQTIDSYIGQVLYSAQLGKPGQ